MPIGAAQNVTDSLAAQLEKVRDVLSLMYERDDELLGLIQKRGDIEYVSARLMRIPLQITPGGRGQQYSPDGGAVGRGSATLYDVAQVTPFYWSFPIEINTQVRYTTDSKEKAVESVVKREVANGMAQFRAFLNKLLQTNGNGVLGTINNVSGTTYTMAVPNGAALVYKGQQIQVYDSTFTINRGSANVTQADPVTAQTITVDASPAGTVATDVIVVQGLAGSLTTQSSLFGLKYHQNSATTGTWLNLNRATYPVELATPRVNGGNAALTPTMARLAYNKMRKALGVRKDQDMKKLIAYMNVEQEHAWENLGITISQVIKEGPGGGADSLDLLFTGQKTIGGVKIQPSIYADQTRIDFIDLSHWGRAVSKDIGYWDDGSGKTIFPIIVTSGPGAGAPQATQWFAFDTGFQVWNDSPRSGAFIDNLARPTGY